MFAKCYVMQIVEYFVLILGTLFTYIYIYKFVHFSMLLIKSFLSLQIIYAYSMVFKVVVLSHFRFDSRCSFVLVLSYFFIPLFL